MSRSESAAMSGWVVSLWVSRMSKGGGHKGRHNPWLGISLVIRSNFRPCRWRALGGSVVVVLRGSGDVRGCQSLIVPQSPVIGEISHRDRQLFNLISSLTPTTFSTMLTCVSSSRHFSPLL